MFLQTWSKYIRVIRILLKRSVKEEQTLDMNKSDFQRAAGGKKIKFTFSFTIVNGRPRETENLSPLAKDLISSLQQDEICYQFIKQKEIGFSMNSSFQLFIKNNTPAIEANSHNEEPIHEAEKSETDNLPEAES
jgi:hypothetical protein